jgi:tRNA pseudouridine38-40 synthase
MSAADAPSSKKRKVAVTLGFVGAGYAGMQRNPGVRTIEDELEEAFHAAGGISAANLGDLRKARCAAARAPRAASRACR